ncbi:MAG: hypothetical protein ACWA5R_11880 [bacterium]
MMKFVKALIVISVFYFSQSAFAENPIDCTNGCTIVTCDSGWCDVWRCDSDGCKHIGAYPDNKEKGLSSTKKPAIPEKNINPSFFEFINQNVYVKTCNGFQCLVQSLKFGQVEDIGTFKDISSEIDLAIKKEQSK